VPRKYLNKEDFDKLYLSWCEEKSLLRKERLFKQILEQYENLIWKTVCRFVGAKHSLKEDCFQAGCIGLLKALQNYDPVRKNRFMTYASWWIRAEVIRSFHKLSGPVAVPIDKRQRVNAEYRKNGEIPEELIAANPRYTYWDAPPGSGDYSEDGTSLRDYLCMRYGLLQEQQPVDEAKILEAKWKVRELVSGLDDNKLRFIVRQRLAGKTLNEVGKGLGLTRERIRQLENIAHLKMKKVLMESEKNNEVPKTRLRA